MRGWEAKRDFPPNKTICWNYEITRTWKLAAQWLEAAAVRFYCFELAGGVSESFVVVGVVR